MTIWKFKVPEYRGDGIKMPRGAKILSTGYQHGELMVWALVDPEAEEVDHLVRVQGTGWTVWETDRFIGTVFEGPYVWHVFDGGEI